MELKELENSSELDYENTMSALKSAETGSGGFSGSYDGEIRSIYSKIVNRPEFSYDFDSDPLYAGYKQDYQRQGRLAMRDSMAQAANLTGGYGSSYAQSVGQQQYGAYLEKLGQIMPELYSAAYERYKAEGDSLAARLSAATELSGMEYSRYADGKDRELQNMKFEYQQRSDAYKALADAISGSGYVPGEEELSRAGMSGELAEALRYEYLRKNDLLPKAQPQQQETVNLWPEGYNEKAATVSIEQMKLDANKNRKKN